MASARLYIMIMNFYRLLKRRKKFGWKLGKTVKKIVEKNLKNILRKKTRKLLNIFMIMF